MKQWKKLAAVLLAVATVASGLYIVVPEGSTAQAASTDDAVFSIKMQAKEHKNEQDEVESVDLRLISSVDSLDYKNVGFEVYFKPDAANPTKNTPITFTTSTVLERISAVSTGVEYNYSPKVIDVDSKYFVTGTLMGISKANLSADFYVRAFYTSLDGNTVTYGVGRYFNVQDATSQSIINIPVKIAEDKLPQADADTKKIPVTVAGVATTATVESWVDGYAHLNVDVPAEATLGAAQEANKEKLASASKVAVGDDSAIYRNLKSTYANNGADASWYTAYDTDADDKFVIATDADLEGLRAKVNEGTSFVNETVYMISDIAMNDKDAVDWATGTIATDPETGAAVAIRSWDKGIGYHNNDSSPKPFLGVFDGQGHIISGVYCKAPGSLRYGIGLFGRLDSTGTIRSLRLENSYFTATAAGNHFMGSIVGICDGTVEKVYSNATVQPLGNFTGGLVGYGNPTIKESWYDGKLIFPASDTWQGYGGIVGLFDLDGVIENCLSTAIITRGSGASKPFNIGGLVGQVYSGASITNSLFAGTMTLGNVGANGLLIGTGTTPNLADTYGFPGAVITAGESLSTYPGVITSSTINDYSAMTATAATQKILPEGETAVEVQMDFYDSVNNPTGKWTMRKGKAPALRSLVTADALYTPDTEFETDEDGYLLISSPEELYGFAKLVNEKAVLDEEAGTTYASANVKLTKSLRLNDTAASTYGTTAAKYTWITIGDNNGTSKVSFTGTFNGQGNTISGIYYKVSNATANQGVGFFGAVGENGKIENLKLLNSYFETTNAANVRIGSIAGNLTNATITQVYSDAYVKANGSFVGGIVGIGIGTTISETWFDGTVYGTGTGNGGLLGYAQDTITISNCLNTGSVTGTYATGSFSGGLIGDLRAGTYQISNCLTAGDLSVVTTTNAGTILGGVPAGAPSITLTDVYAVADAKVTNVIGKGSVQTGSVYGQKDKASITGYGALNNLGALNTDNLWVERIDDVPALAIFTPTSERIYQDGYYMIGSADDLYGFASEFNAGRIASNANAKLTADIVLNVGTATEWKKGEAPTESLTKWTPIGSYGNGSGIRFAGTFDGAGHTISGLYCEVPAVRNQGVGLFGSTAAGAKIQNLRLTNSYFKQSATENPLVGSIMGYGEGTFTRIYSDAIMDTRSSYSGGLIGGISGASSISECWYNGTLNILVDITGVGGIVGRADQGATITNCLNSGTINGETYGACVGGIIGMHTAGLQMVNSLNTGDVNVRAIASNGKVIGDVQGPITLTNVFSTGTTSGNVYGRITGNGSLASGAVQGVITEAITSGNASTLLQGFDFDTVWTMDGDQPVLRF